MSRHRANGLNLITKRKLPAPAGARRRLRNYAGFARATGTMRCTGCGSRACWSTIRRRAWKDFSCWSRSMTPARLSKRAPNGARRFSGRRRTRLYWPRLTRTCSATRTRNCRTFRSRCGRSRNMPKKRPAKNTASRRCEIRIWGWLKLSSQTSCADRRTMRMQSLAWLSSA